MKGAQAGVRHHFSGDMFRISGKPLDAGAAMEDSPLSRTAEGPLERENPRCSVRFVGGEVGPSGAIKAAGELTGGPEKCVRLSCTATRGSPRVRALSRHARLTSWTWTRPAACWAWVRKRGGKRCAPP